MKKLIVFVMFACCVPIAVPACQTPAVKNAEHAAEVTGEACLKVDIWQPVEQGGISLIAKVGAALLTGGGMSALDQGEAQVKTDLQTLPATVEPIAVNCAVKTAVAIFDAATMAKSFAGGPDVRVVSAATIGKRLLAQRGAGGS